MVSRGALGAGLTELRIADYLLNPSASTKEQEGDV